MANEGYSADHLRTILEPAFNLALPPARQRGDEVYGTHVVDFLGEDLPWSSLGRVAIQCFRSADPCVYFIGGDVGAIKIGVSIAPLERLATMQMGSPVKLRILALVEGGMDAEKEYHRLFANHRSHGEWFERHPDILCEIERLRRHS